LCVCDLVETLELSQSVVSRHLAYLRNNGLVSTRREGVWVYYRIVTGCCELQLKHISQCGVTNEEIQADLVQLKATRQSQQCG